MKAPGVTGIPSNVLGLCPPPVAAMRPMKPVVGGPEVLGGGDTDTTGRNETRQQYSSREIQNT